MTDILGALFVCLAEYNCPCRPPGRPVTSSTVRRHRKRANERRACFGLPPLPNGPKYSTERAHFEARRHGQLFEHNGEGSEIYEVVDTSGRKVRLEIGDYSPPRSILSNFSSHVCENQMVYTAVAETGNEVSHTFPVTDGNGMNVTPVTDLRMGDGNETTFWDPNDIVEAVHISDVEKELQVTRHNTQSPDSPSHGRQMNFAQLSDDGEQPDLNEFSSLPTRRAHEMSQFREFCVEHKEWIALGIDFSLTREAMNRVLKNISAPYKSWVTVRRNLQKYSGLYTEKYYSCDGHMLLSPDQVNGCSLSADDLSSIRKRCIVCEERKTTFRLSSFEYIPLKPRLEKWFLNEESYKALFEYRSLDSFNRNTMCNSDANERYADFYDGSLFEAIVRRRGGRDTGAYDIFLDISFDGFQTFANNSYDCWPIVAMIHNLPPSVRYISRNAVPIGYVKGPKEPVRLDTFLWPFVNEVNKINNDGKGTVFDFADGTRREVMVHVLWCKSDSPAAAKCTGFKGSNAKFHCRFCGVEGHYDAAAKHYYYPSRILVPSDIEGSRRRMKTYYDPTNLPMRSSEDIMRVYEMLEKSDLTKRERDELRKNTGLSRRTTIFELSSLTPFTSFPIDNMHLSMNLFKDLVAIWKDDAAIGVYEDGGVTDFIVSSKGWDMIDLEMERLGAGTSQATFGRKPRTTDVYKTWKAEECKSFLFYYSLIVMEGNLSRRYLQGLRQLSNLLELCSRPILSAEDVEQIGTLSNSYFRHFEDAYYQYKHSRARLCKSTVHSILHLKENVMRCGPLAGCSQFWMERYINTVKGNLNAKSLAAESLTENTKLYESYKLFLGEHFRRPDRTPRHDARGEDGLASGSESEVEKDSISTDPVSGAVLLTPRSRSSVNEERFSRFRLRDLLKSYARRCLGLTATQATDAVAEDNFIPYSRVKLQCGAGVSEIGLMLLGRPTKKRGDFYIAACYAMQGTEQSVTMEKVYYGRINFLMKYDFVVDGQRMPRFLFMADWARDLRKNFISQLYSSRPMAQVFGDRSVEDVGIIMHGIGYLVHENPEARTKRGFFLDPQQMVHRLLEPGKPSPDGIDMVLAGMN